MCFFSSPKQPDPPPPPAAPIPDPVPVPSQATASEETQDQRRKKIDSMKYGAMSTIKTGPQGITGAGPDLASSAAGGLYGGDFANKKSLGT